MKILIYVYSIFVVSGCASVNQQTPVGGPAYAYRADMQVSFDNGLTLYDGTTSAKMASGGTLPIAFISPVNIDRVQFTTCARQAVCQSGGYCDSNFAISKNWTGSVSNTFVYNYSPTPDEALGLCPAYVESYSKQALTSWAFIGFIGDEKLPGTLYCNGKLSTPSGVTVCQSLAGNENALTFATAVKSEAEKNCNMTTTDNMNFKFIPSAGLCRATFVDANKNFHRAIMIGYSSVLVRSN